MIRYSAMINELYHTASSSFTGRRENLKDAT